MRLTSERLMINSFADSDISAQYIGWLNDPELMKFSEQRHKFHSQASCLQYLQSFKNTANHFLAIKSSSSGELLGTMTVYIDTHNATADMGILVGKAYSNTGIGTEAWALVQNELLTSSSIRKITAGTLKINIGMLSIMQKNKMVSDGVRKSQHLVKGEPTDIIYKAKFK